MTRGFRPNPVHRALLAIAVVATATPPLSAQMMVPKAAPASGDKLFGQQCGACHSAKAGETRVGPSLAGVFGRKAGSLPGYQYSAALKKSGLTWNAASLDKWLTRSQATVPGSKMSYAQADAAKRQAIIAYLTKLPK
ncbi:c-type cytochrome [Sphingomonas sp. M1A8_2b]